MGPFRRNFLEVEIWGVWLKEGDRNVRFLHKMVDTYKRRNLLAKIKINGTWFAKENKIKEGVVSAFLKPSHRFRGVEAQFKQVVV